MQVYLYDVIFISVYDEKEHKTRIKLAKISSKKEFSMKRNDYFKFKRFLYFFPFLRFFMNFLEFSNNIPII